MDGSFQYCQAPREIFPNARQFRAIHLHAGRFHIAQHRDHAAFDLLIARERPISAQTRAQQQPQPQRHIRIFGGIGGGFIQWHFTEQHARLAGAGHLIKADRLMAQMQNRKLIHAMAMPPGFHGVGQHHGVINWADIGKAAIFCAGQDFQIIFRVLENLEHGSIGEKRAQQREGGFRRNLFWRRRGQHIACAAMADWHIAGATRRDGKRKPNHIGAARIQAIGFRIHTHHASFSRQRDPTRQGGFIRHAIIRAEGRRNIESFCCGCFGRCCATYPAMRRAARLAKTHARQDGTKPLRA